jgi:hypothetical protein
MKTRSIVKVIGCLVAIFLLGSATGAMLMHLFDQRTAGQRQLERDWAERELHTLKTRLKLRPEQVETLRPVIGETANAMRLVRVDTARQLASLIRRNSDQVSRELDAEQKQLFDNLIQERKAQKARLQESGDRWK